MIFYVIILRIMPGKLKQKTKEMLKEKTPVTMCHWNFFWNSTKWRIVNCHGSNQEKHHHHTPLTSHSHLSPYLQPHWEIPWVCFCSSLILPQEKGHRDFPNYIVRPYCAVYCGLLTLNIQGFKQTNTLSFICIEKPSKMRGTSCFASFQWICSLRG